MARGSGLPPSELTPPSKGGSLICLLPHPPPPVGAGVPKQPAHSAICPARPPPPPPGSRQKELAASSLSIGCLDGSLVSGLTCLKLGCRQTGDVCTTARRHTHSELGAGGEQTLGLVPARSGSSLGELLIAPRAGETGRKPAPQVPSEGLGPPATHPGSGPVRTDPQPAPPVKLHFIPALLPRDSGLDIWVPRAKGCVQTRGPTQPGQGSRQVPGRGPGGRS